MCSSGLVTPGDHETSNYISISILQYLHVSESMKFTFQVYSDESSQQLSGVFSIDVYKN